MNSFLSYFDLGFNKKYYSCKTLSDTKLCKLLPQSIVDIILEYDGRIHNRSGKYINRILKTDPRYNLLRQIPPIVFVRREFITRYSIRFSNERFILQKFIDYYNVSRNESGKGENKYRDVVSTTYSYLIINGDRYEFIHYYHNFWATGIYPPTNPIYRYDAVAN